MFKRLLVLAAAAIAGWALLGVIRRRSAPDEPLAQLNPPPAREDADAGAVIDDEVVAALETPHTAEADLAEQAFVAAALAAGARHATRPAAETQPVDTAESAAPDGDTQA